MKIKREIPAIGSVIFVICWLIFFYLATNIRPFAIMTNAWTQKESIEHDYMIEHPAEWVKQSLSREDDDVILLLMNAGAFQFRIRRQATENPTPEDVAAWGKAMIGERNQRARMKGNPLGYADIEVSEEIINGERVILRKFGKDSTINLDAYIARENDMIILALETHHGQFSLYEEDFMRVVHSFSPME